MVASFVMRALTLLEHTISDCTRCPRLTTYRREVAKEKVKRFQDWDYWGRPIPGDRIGDWLYEALYTFGFANQPESVHRNDGLILKNCYVAAAVRCAPPANKPTKDEFEACRPYVLEELRLLCRIQVVVALGKMAFDEYLRTCQMAGHVVSSPRPKFSHGAEYALPGKVTLLASYHPSQQNTFTGMLTRSMFHQVFRRAKMLIDKP